MRLVYVINSLATGGAEKILSDLAIRIHEMGIALELVILNGMETPFLKEIMSHGIKVTVLGNSNVYNPFHIFQLIPIISKADVVHVHLFPSLYWVALAKIFSFSKTPLIFTEHSTTNRRRNSVLYRLMDRIIYRKYKRIVAISNEVKLELNSHLRYKSNRFLTITNGVDLKQFSEAHKIDKSQIVKNPDDRLLIQVARFSKSKDQETVIRAMELIQQPITLLLVGKGKEEARMKQLVQSLELQDRVVFLGERIDIADLLKTVDIAILSSQYEGLSLSGLEALASGTPVIASNVPGLSTLVYGAGLFFNYGDEVDLANKINSLLSDPILFEEMSKKALSRAKKYNLNTMVEAYVDLYETLCRN